METIRERSKAQDIAKCLLIVAVVLYHCLLTVRGNEAVETTFNQLFAMFPFLMAAFFFYSGYNHNPGKRTFAQDLKRRASQLLIPLVILFPIGVALTGLFAFLGVGANWGDIYDTFLYILMSEGMANITGFKESHVIVMEVSLMLSIWFILILFLTSIPFYLLVKYTNKNVGRLISIDALCLFSAYLIAEFVPHGTLLPYCVNMIPIVLSIMLTAAYLKQRNFLDRPIVTKRDAIFLAINSFVAWGIVIAVSYLGFYVYNTNIIGAFPWGKINNTIKGADAFIGFLFSICGTFALHQLCRSLALIPHLSKGLAYLGIRSPLLYLTHPIFIAFFHDICFRGTLQIGEFQPYLYTILTIITFVLLSLLLGLIPKQMKRRKAKEAHEA